MLNFLSSILKDDGGYEYRRGILNTIVAIIHEVPDAQEGCLERLCECIEDCEYPNLTTSILHLLGTLGPTTSNPSQYIRYIYNRIVLENASVRAAAVSALAKFGAVDAGIAKVSIGRARP